MGPPYPQSGKPALPPKQTRMKQMTPRPQVLPWDQGIRSPQQRLPSSSPPQLMVGHDNTCCRPVGSFTLSVIILIGVHSFHWYLLGSISCMIYLFSFLLSPLLHDLFNCGLL